METLLTSCAHAGFRNASLTDLHPTDTRHLRARQPQGQETPNRVLQGLTPELHGPRLYFSHVGTRGTEKLPCVGTCKQYRILRKDGD